MNIDLQITLLGFRSNKKIRHTAKSMLCIDRYEAALTSVFGGVFKYLKGQNHDMWKGYNDPCAEDSSG